MAVSVVRALLIVRLQSELNRLRRELGGAGQAALALVCVLVLAACAPPSYGAYVVGREAALRLASSAPRPGAPVLAGLHALSWLGFALLGGLLADGVRLARGVRVFPVGRWRLVLTELLTSIAAPLPLLTLGCLLGLSLGVCRARPGLAPWALLLAAEGLVWMLVAQRWIASLRQRLSRQLLWPAAILAAVAASSAALAERGQALSAARLFGRGLAWFADLLPTSIAWRGLAAFADGRNGDGLLAQLAGLGATALLLLTAVWASRFESPAAADLRGGRRRAPRLWSFGRPATGIARLFVLSVAQSRGGRTLLLMPAFLAVVSAVVGIVLGSALAKLSPATEMTPSLARALASLHALRDLPWAGLLPPLVVIMSSDLWMNQFGWDGAGVKTLLGLPIAPRQLLLGKLLGLAGLTLVQLSLLLPVLAAAAWRAPLDLAWGLAACVLALVALGGLGHVFSAGLPRRADQGSTAQGFTGMILAACSNFSVCGVLLVGYQLSRLAGPLGPPLGLGALAAATAYGYWRVLDVLGERVLAQRDQLINHLG